MRTLLLLVLALPSGAASLELISAVKLWEEGVHNAFTDLIRFRDRWYCTFREAEGHVGGDGRIRVLESADGAQWRSAALIEETGIDLRDPKFSIAADGRLMIVAGGSVYQGTKVLKGRQPRVMFSKDARTWTPPQRVLGDGDWLWRVTWHKNRAYGVTYNYLPDAGGARDVQEQGTEWSLKLVESSNGVDWNLITRLAIPGRPNETTLRFLANGDCVALVRREAIPGHPDNQAWIGAAAAPYTNWTWNPAGHRFGGPNFIVLPDGRWIAGGRDYRQSPDHKMAIGFLTRDSYRHELVFESGGDTSYPGFVWRQGVLWTSYYSSHDGKSKIYLAKVRVR